MSPELIFKHRYEKETTLELLEISVILRQMFLDGNPLIDQVNRKHKLKLLFPVGTSTVDSIKRDIERDAPLPAFFVRGDVTLKDDDVFYVNRNRFLSHPVCYIDGTHYTSRDIINLCANKLGGIHADAADKDTDKESAIRAINKHLSVLGMPFAFASLRAVGRCAHIGLNDLYNLVSKEFVVS